MISAILKRKLGGVYPSKLIACLIDRRPGAQNSYIQHVKRRNHDVDRRYDRQQLTTTIPTQTEDFAVYTSQRKKTRFVSTSKQVLIRTTVSHVLRKTYGYTNKNYGTFRYTSMGSIFQSNSTDIQFWQNWCGSRFEFAATYRSHSDIWRHVD